MEPAEAVHEINEIHTDHPASERHESELPPVESPRSEVNSEAAKQFDEIDIGDNEVGRINQDVTSNLRSSQKSQIPHSVTPI